MFLSRRRVLATAVTGCALAAAPASARGLFNQCRGPELPPQLQTSEFLHRALRGLNGSALWDTHVHLVGVGDGGGGAWTHPHMRSLLHPLQYLRFRFYLNAACSGHEHVDESYVRRLRALIRDLPAGARAMLLAFDFSYDESGHKRPERSAFYTPNEYAAWLAQRYPDDFEWIASIHPYRQDCVEALAWAAANGARAVKWLPPVMGIDPASPLCDRFYTAIRHHELPLLTHAGDEHAVAGRRIQALGNPLLLRRPLEHGVRVIVAHCASLGGSADLDAGGKAKDVQNYLLFARLMDEPAYAALLYGDISALTQRNRLGAPLELMVRRQDWHGRLLNGSDYPLPAVPPVFSLRGIARAGYLDDAAVPFLSRIQHFNPLLFDLCLKRLLRVDGLGFGAEVFHTRRHFTAGIFQRNS